ncbi:MAG: hypothetical protein Q9204_000436 [Flavoplaca sp. TL-2023a]
MPFSPPSLTLALSCALLVAVLASPVAAFGAGNIASIAKIEGQNWRHGDIEDTLLNILMSRAAGGKKFSKMDVKRVYFGNWLRDYSQAVDVGTVKYVSAEAIRILLWVLGFMSFGYATKEFEVTTERLGCYRPEEHIDNPKDYADNIDARQYDRRLRGPVDERRELAINPRTGLKVYIATEGMGIATSAGLIRDLFRRSIHLGRQYGQSKNKADLYEALRLLGTACHCLEDYSAHSNYTELALIELGERGVFPHVGRRTQITLQETGRSVFPCVTGTFGGVDFLHSVMGEVSDKATQSEIEELQGTIQSQSGGNNTSILQDLLNQVPSGLFGGKDEAGKANELQMNAQAAQMQNTHITPREPEAWTRQLEETQKQIYPILEWHDEMMQSITETIEKIPILPDLIEQLQEQLNVFVFGLLAPFVLPIINQVKTELNTGSSEIIQSSKDKQLIVFHDDYSSDPTHSMLSKDHFSNILNEPAGKVASQVLKWVVPQLMACWDDEYIDVDRTITRIVNGVFHHPALRDFGDDGAVDGRRGMFQVVEEWWGPKDERERQHMRQQLSREGVEQGQNHKPGVQDRGHGCGKPLGMPTMKTAQSSGAIGGLATGGVLGEISSALAGESNYDSGYTGQRPPAKSGGGSASNIGKFAEEAVGGGIVGGLVGGLVGGVGNDLLGDAFGGSKAEKQTYGKQKYGDNGSYTQSVTETGYSHPQYGSEQQRYGQAEYSQTSYPGGGQRQEYQRYQQDDRSGVQSGYGAYGEQVIKESRPTYGGGYDERTETRFEGPAGEWQSEVRREGRDERGEYYRKDEHHGGKKYKGKSDDSDDSQEKRRKKEEKKYKKEEKKYKKYGSGGSDDDSDDSHKKKKKEKKEKKKENGGGYGGGTEDYSREHSYGGQEYGGGRQEYGGGRQDYGNGREEYGSSRQGYGSSGYESSQQQPYGGGGYGGSQQYGSSYQEEPPRQQSQGMGARYEQQEAYSGGGGGYGGGGYGASEERSYGGGEQRMPGGFGEDEYQGRSGGYGGGHGGYGGREERSYGGGEEMPGGFGDGDEYQERSGGYGGDRGYGGNDERGYGDRY